LLLNHLCNGFSITCVATEEDTYTCHRVYTFTLFVMGNGTEGLT